MENPSTFQVTEHGGIDPQAESPRFVAKHLSAYHFAKPFATGRTLEIGFGDGYGAYLLSQVSQEMLAVDLFLHNVEAAYAKYLKPKLQFLKMDATALSFPKNYFDLVVSFQVIEHIPRGLLGRYVGEMRRVMKEGGVACISTLNLKKNQKPGQPYQKAPHHDKEFAPSEFRSFLTDSFRSVEVYGLYPTFEHAFIEGLKKSGLVKAFPAGINPVSRFYGRITPRDFYWKSQENLDGCIDLLAVCRN